MDSAQSTPVLESAPPAAAVDERAAWRRFLFISNLVIVFALVTMFLGPLVRAESAGLACPDWPLCHGKIVPWGHGYQVMLEFIHRVAGGLTVFAVGAWLWFALAPSALRRVLLWPAIIAAGLITLQVLLGLWTITEQLDAYVVKSHLLNAILFLATIVYGRHRAKLSLRTGAPATPQRDRLSGMVVGLFVIVIFAQLFLGGRVSANQAGLVCPAFPACYYEEVARADGGVLRQPVYLPPYIGATEKHLTHRFMGYALFLISIGIVVLAEWRRWPHSWARSAWFLLCAILLQIFIGALNVLHHVPVTITVIHSFVAYVIFLAAWMLWLEMRLERKPT